MGEQLTHTAQARANQFYTLFLAVMATTVVAALFLTWVHGFIPQKPRSSTVDLIVDAYKGLVLPEPSEQFTFALLAILVPIVALVLSVSRMEPVSITDSGPACAYFPPIVAGIFLWTIFGSDFLPTIARDFLKSYTPLDSGFLIAALLAAVLLCLELIRSSRSSTTGRRAGTFAAWAIFLTAVLLQMTSWRIVSFASVLPPISPWEGHADPLFYVIAQVHQGKTLLSDLPSQYGLFPEMLSPIFRVVGLTVGRASLLFALLQMISMIGLFFVLERFVRSRLLLTITGLALVQLTFATVVLNASYEDPYFQYWPLRFFWPAVSVVVFHWFSRRPNHLRACVLSAVGAVALVWNLDSGLFIVVAFGAYPAARSVMSWMTRSDAGVHDNPGPRTYALALASHVAITLAIAAAFMGVLTLKAGQPLRLRWIFEYQRVFADLGLAMLPLPRRPHPWMAVLAIYLAGLLQAFFMWKRGSRVTVKADILFYLSMLGLGLFAYYVGRSHILNLVAVCWPAAMLIAIFADDTLRMLRAKALAPSTITIAIVACAMLLLAAGSFVARVPLFTERAGSQFSTRGQASDPLASSELAFIKRHAPAGSACLILASRQGIYHAQAQVASPYRGPGIVETVLIADQRRMMDEVFAGAYPCLFVGLGPKSAPNFKVDMPKLLGAYVVADQISGDTMIYLQPRP
jgi:hypothetical protein